VKGKSRILVFDEWFEEFAPGTYVEDDLEKKIISAAAVVFPEYIMLPLRQTIEYEDERSQPDLCLIKNDYSDWYVIEVELDKKPFRGHTEMQIRVFSKGRYNATSITDYLFKKNNTLDKSKLYSMVRNVEPKILIMVNEYPTWATEALSYPRTGIFVFGMYDHPDNIEAYRIDGNYPIKEVDRSRCKFPKYPANILHVLTPSCLDSGGDSVIIFYEGRKSKWKRVDDKKNTYLVPAGRNPLNVSKQYYLIKDTEGNFFLKQN